MVVEGCRSHLLYRATKDQAIGYAATKDIRKPLSPIKTAFDKWKITPTHIASMSGLQQSCDRKLTRDSYVFGSATATITGSSGGESVTT